jgi:hypothetical protein
MLRKTIIALLALTAVGLVSPTGASARDWRLLGGKRITRGKSVSAH